MNVAYGEPERHTLPFDLSHHRFPIRYNVPEDASEEVRKEQRAALTKEFEHAVRVLLDSDEYKSTLPKEPGLPQIDWRKSLNGNARFRDKGQPIGYYRPPLAKLVGGADEEIFLDEGSAIWLRVRPEQPINPPMKIVDIEQHMINLARFPLVGSNPNTQIIRGNDGYGCCTILDGNSAPNVVFLFTDGEIWAIDTFSLRMENQISIDESTLSRRLQQYAGFLDSLGIKGPYRWNIGIENVRGRSLALPGPFERAMGSCAENLIEQPGAFDLSDDPKDKLQPFFELVFEQCGVRRPSRSPT